MNWRITISLGILWLGITLLPVFGATPKRVLIVHSFGMAAPPFTTHSTAFETALTEGMGERVDLDEVSLDMARYADLDMQQALVEFLRHRQAKWQPDLVVPIGSPAGVFVAQYRNQLFPATTPVIYTGMDRRRLPPGALEKNAAFVGESFDLPGMVEDMLQVAPATTNIVVVLGDSPVEQYWAAAIQHEWEPFTNRVSFTWLNKLSFDDMLERVGKLPPRSFIFLILLMRDASGVTHNADEALKRIHAVANAPVNSIYRYQLGMGIVGGRLYQAELEGAESARIAIRVLHGESVTNFPPKIIGALGPLYDWQELQRWNISETQLPRGSKVLFRHPSLWQQYKWWIVAGVSVCIVEVLIIFVLLMNLTILRQMKKSLQESHNRLQGVLGAAVDGIVTISERGIIESVNPAMEKLFGYGSSEMLGQNASMLMPASYGEEHDLGSYLCTHDPKTIGIDHELSGRRKNGSIFPLDLVVSEVQLPNGRLFTAFARDITMRKQAEQAARELTGQLIQAHEQERSRLARELHDDVTQRLAVLAIEVGSIELKADNAFPVQMLRGVRKGLARLSEDIHGLSYRLHSAVLEDLGLAEALKVECEQFSQREKIPANVKLRDVPSRIRSDISLCLYRIAQEALRNISRHARADTVEVTLYGNNGTLQLFIRDDGVGFDPALKRQRTHLGLASMQERIRLVGGELNIESAPRQGTNILASVPLEGEHL